MAEFNEATKGSVLLKEVFENTGCEIIYLPDEKTMVYNNNVNRPGLPLSGYFNHFEPSRIQIIGVTEYTYMMQLEDEDRKKKLEDFMSRKPIALIFSTSLIPSQAFMKIAEKYKISVAKTASSSSEYMSRLIALLNVKLAPMITRHGVLVEIYGEGVLILGESGVGKSETAIELVKRGHRLIADDAVELRKVSDITIVGSAPEVIRHYVELRGIGIVDVKRIFGVGAVKDTEKIDIVVRLEPWQQGKSYDRMGLETEYTDIMGIKVPTTTIPVHPGRNLAVILEIAAMNNRQKRMGYNSAVEFNKKIMQRTGMSEEEILKSISMNGGETKITEI